MFSHELPTNHDDDDTDVKIADNHTFAHSRQWLMKMSHMCVWVSERNSKTTVTIANHH